MAGRKISSEEKDGSRKASFRLHWLTTIAVMEASLCHHLVATPFWPNGDPLLCCACQGSRPFRSRSNPYSEALVRLCKLQVYPGGVGSVTGQSEGHTESGWFASDIPASERFLSGEKPLKDSCQLGMTRRDIPHKEYRNRGIPRRMD